MSTASLLALRPTCHACHWALSLRGRLRPARALAMGLLMLVDMAAVSSVVHAAPVPWDRQNVSYVADRRPLKQVVKDVLTSQPFAVVMYGDIRGEVTGQFNEPAEQVIKKLAAAYGLVWFFDGSVLYVSPLSDLRSTVVELGGMDPRRVPDMLAGLGLLEERFPVRVSNGSVLVSGPSRYVELVVKALGAQKTTAPTSSASPQPRRMGPSPVKRRIRVYQLTYAQASDVIRVVNGRNETIPGIAGLLRRLGHDDSAGRGDGSYLPEDARIRERVLALGADGEPGITVAQWTDPGSADAIVEADVRTNSVVVRASKEILDYYGEVIKSLDQPRQLVQLDVTILSVASSDVREVGVKLGAQVGHGSPTSPVDEGEKRPPGLLFDGIIGTSARNISVRVAALEQQGKLKVLSRPRLVGLENLQAVIGSQTTAHVRVAGTYQTDLYPVRAGLQLKVMPRVVSHSGEPVQILLALDIIDGQLQQSVQVDGIPVTDEVAVSSQTVVAEGQTLLIGGHRKENIGRDHSGVPGLSRVPLLGALFRRRRENHDFAEQLFLITPRLVVKPDRGDSAGEANAHQDVKQR